MLGTAVGEYDKNPYGTLSALLAINAILVPNYLKIQSMGTDCQFLLCRS